MAEAAAPVTGGSASALAPLPVGGRRHRKLKLVTRKTARKALKRMGLKMRGGEAAAAPEAAASAPAPAGGRRHRRRSHRRGGDDTMAAAPAAAAPSAGRRRHTKRRSLFGLRY